MVVDTETGKVSGDVKGLTNVRDIALDDSGKYGYVTDVTDGSAGFVRVFDRSTLKIVTSIPTGLIPYAIVFDPITKSMFVFNSRGHSATVIDTATNQVVATIPLSGRPSSAVGDGKGSVFVALPALGEITRIDAAAKKVTASWQLAPCTGPAGLAIDSARRQLFTTCENHKIFVLNADTGHVAPPSAMHLQTQATSTSTLCTTCSFSPMPQEPSPSFTATHQLNIPDSRK